MNRHPVFAVGVRNGRSFKLQYRRLCDVLIVPLRSFRWHLWIEGEYRGNFKTKREALAFIDAESRGIAA